MPVPGDLVTSSRQAMTPGERILSTIERKPVDRTPVDLWVTPEVLDSLREHTGERDELAQ